MSEQCVIEANADVSGPGIRSSIYALVLASHICVPIARLIAKKENSNAFERSLHSVLGIQGLALLFTAIYQTAVQSLTLFHAVCVIHLLALLGVNVVPKANFKRRRGFHEVVKILLTAASLLAFIGWTVYVFAQTPTFGSQPECNDTTIYVVFGISIKLTTPVLRWTLVAILASVALGFIMMLTCSVTALVVFGGAILHWSEGLRQGLRSKIDDLRQETFHSNEPLSAGGDHAHDRPVRLLIDALCLVGFDVYAIVSLEQTISRNVVSMRERQWTFGQILALFLLIGAVLDICGLIIRTRFPLNTNASGSATTITDGPGAVLSATATNSVDIENTASRSNAL